MLKYEIMILVLLEKTGKILLQECGFIEAFGDYLEPSETSIVPSTH